MASTGGLVRIPSSRGPVSPAGVCQGSPLFLLHVFSFYQNGVIFTSLVISGSECFSCPLTFCISQKLFGINAFLFCRKLRDLLQQRLIKFFIDQSKKDAEKYAKFFEDYGLFMREGIVTTAEQEVKVGSGFLGLSLGRHGLWRPET